MLRPHGLASAPQLPKLDPFFISLTIHSIFLRFFIGKSTLEGCLCRCWKGLSTAQPKAKTPEVPLYFENANFYGVQNLSPSGVPRRMRWGEILVE